MKQRDYWFLVVLVVLSGLIGGAVSNWLFVSQDVSVQMARPVVVAEEFRLVDKDGNLRGRLYVDEQGRGQLDLVPGSRAMPVK